MRGNSLPSGCELLLVLRYAHSTPCLDDHLSSNAATGDSTFQSQFEPVWSSKYNSGHIPTFTSYRVQAAPPGSGR